MQPEPDPRPSLARTLALNRTVGIVLLTVLFFGLGEELWSHFMPVYLEAQGRQPPGGIGFRKKVVTEGREDQEVDLPPGGVIETTVGRVLFNTLLPPWLPFYDLALSARRLSRIVRRGPPAPPPHRTAPSRRR